MTVPPGARSAQRWTNAHNGITDGVALILYGQWKPGDGRLDSVPRGAKPMSGVHALSIQVNADESRLASIVSGINFSGLSGVAAK